MQDSGEKSVVQKEHNLMNRTTLSLSQIWKTMSKKNIHRSDLIQNIHHIHSWLIRGCWCLGPSPPHSSPTNSPHLLPGTCMAACLRGEGGHTVTHSAPDRTNCSRPAGARGFVFHPFFSGTSCGLSAASDEPSDAAAINMRQRVWVSDSCTVDQGHTVLALSGRATPKKANPVWEH